MIEVLWYRCANDYCLRYNTPTEIYPGEEAACGECGSMMHAMDPPPERST